MTDADADADSPAARSGPRLVMVLDAVDTEAVAAFWAAALGYRRVTIVEQYEVLEPPAPDRPPLLVQGVAEPKTAKNRMHLDLHVADAEVEAARLVALGATRVADGSLGQIRWITMRDPEGNEFDVCYD